LAPQCAQQRAFGDGLFVREGAPETRVLHKEEAEADERPQAEASKSGRARSFEPVSGATEPRPNGMLVALGAFDIGRVVSRSSNVAALVAAS